MKSLRLISLLLVLLLLVVPVFGQEETADAPEATQEVVIVQVPVVEAPAADGVDAPSDTTDWIDPDMMNILVVGVLGVGLASAFYVILQALAALKVSVPQEVVTVFGNQLIELINQTRHYLKTESEKTSTPLDNMAVSIMDVPLDAIYQEIRRRTGADIPVEMKMVGDAETLPS